MNIFSVSWIVIVSKYVYNTLLNLNIKIFICTKHFYCPLRSVQNPQLNYSAFEKKKKKVVFKFINQTFVSNINALSHHLLTKVGTKFSSIAPIAFVNRLFLNLLNKWLIFTAHNKTPSKYFETNYTFPSRNNFFKNAILTFRLTIRTP